MSLTRACEHIEEPRVVLISNNIVFYTVCLFCSRLGRVAIWSNRQLSDTSNLPLTLRLATSARRPEQTYRALPVQLDSGSRDIVGEVSHTSFP